MKSFIRFSPLLFFPLLFIGWGIFVVTALDPFYMRSVDPEFPYLLNGLTVARLELADIGHFDHPGTPFQVFIGMSMRLIHLISGEGSLTQDVLGRHEHYMRGISLMLTVLTSLALLAIGIAGRKRCIATWLLVLLQGGFLLSDMIMWEYARMVPERWMMLTSLLFVRAYMLYAYESQNMKQFAIWSGVILGMGLATKFNYLPVLVIPLFIIQAARLRLLYIGMAVASFMTCIAPVMHRIGYYLGFITSMAKHDGLYGSGEARMFNMEKIWGSLHEMFGYTPELALWIALLLATWIVAWLLPTKSRQGDTSRLFPGFLFALSLQIIMVAKHFKIAYQVPMFSLFGFMLFSAGLFLLAKFKNMWAGIVPVALLFVIMTAINVSRASQYADLVFALKYQRQEVVAFVERQMPAQPAWFVEPAWLNGPHPENALIFGLSYARNRDKYLTELRRINPLAITYEGNPDEVKLWRGESVSLDSVMAAGTTVHIYDTPGRNAWLLLDMLQQSVNRQGLQLHTDTIFSQAETHTRIMSARAIP